MKKILVLIVLVFPIFTEEIVLKKDTESLDISSNSFLIEEDKEYTNEEIINLYKEKKMIRVTEFDKSFAPTIINYSFAFEVKTEDILSKQFYFHGTNIYAADLKLFCNGKKSFSYKTGLKYKYKERPVKNKLLLFPLDFLPNENSICIIRQRMGTGNRRLGKLEIFSNEYLVNISNQEEIKDGILYGILFFSLINSFILFITFRKVIYLLYSFYIIFISFVILSGKGDLIRLFEDTYIESHTGLIGFSSIPLAVFFNTEFTRLFFERTIENKLLNFFSLLPRILILPIILYSLFSNTLVEMIYINNIFALGALVVGFIFGVVSWKNNYSYAKYYVWSFFIIFIGVVLSNVTAKLYGSNSSTVSYVYYSIIAEIFLLSFALADKQKKIEIEKDKAKEETILIQKEANENLEKKVIERTFQLNEEKNKSEKLLLNILPKDIADELKNLGKVKPREYFSSILFTDFHGFTKISENLSPEELISELDECFRFFDSLMDKYNLEKLKTIGDSFMCVGGIPNENSTHAIDICFAAIEMRDFIFKRNIENLEKNKTVFEIRIGIHTGRVIAGVIGEKKFSYDIWGDSVNIASRMESSSIVGKINISESTYSLVKDKFLTTSRGEIYAKNKGEMKMYFLEKEI